MTEREQLIQLLGDKEWRLFSGKLYFIKDKQGNRIPFIPNKQQTHYYHNRHTKNIILKARQLGFSTFIDIMSLDKALFSSYKSMGIIADDRDSAELIFRDKVKFAFDNLPKWLKDNFKVKTDRKGELVFESNHCSVSVDTSFRGGTLQHLHISEYGKICNKYPEKAREIQTGALNTVAPTSEVDIESTAEGNSGNYFDMCQKAMEMQEMGKELTDMDYKFHFYAWWLDDTYELQSGDVITSETREYFRKVQHDSWIQKNHPDIRFTEAKMRWYQKKQEEQKEDMLREYPSYPKEAFDLAIKGAYYEKELGITRQQNRVGRFPYDPRLPVNTHWDLGGAGGGDETAIWFYQILGKEVRIIDYWEGSGYGLTEIAMSIVNTRYDNYDTHYLPHDAEVTEYSTGVARIQTARQYLKGKVEVVAKLSISDGINAVRDMFPNCFFNEETTTVGLTRLAGYRREYDEKNGIFRDKPKHDINSNGCFTGNTKVNTVNGLKNIRDISVGEFVYTPKGAKKVLRVINNGFKETIKTNFSNGIEISSTPDHKFFSKGEYKRIDSISYLDKIDTLSYLSKLKWKLNTLTEKRTNLENDRNIGIKHMQGKCTLMYGNFTMGNVLNDFIYIIKMETLSIMIYLISNVLKLVNTYQNTEKKIGKMIQSEKKCKYDSKKQENQQKSGTEARSELSGIKNTMKKLKKNFIGKVLEFAKIVKKNTNQLENDSAQITVNHKTEEIRELITLQNNVSTVEKILYLISIIISKDVNIVHIKDNGIREVFDLEVEGEHCYYVEGLHVHNSDAFRYLAVSYKNKTRVQKPLGIARPRF